MLTHYTWDSCGPKDEDVPKLEPKNPVTLITLFDEEAEKKRQEKMKMMMKELEPPGNNFWGQENKYEPKIINGVYTCPTCDEAEKKGKFNWPHPCIKGFPSTSKISFTK